MSPSPAVLSFVVSAVVASASVLGACYETPKPACAFACARDQSCPEGYACDPQDQICHRELPGGGLEACERPFVDAAPIDASAAIDAARDAAVDAAVDAAPAAR